MCYGGTELNWLWVDAWRVFVDAMSGTIKTGISRPSEKSNNRLTILLNDEVS